jgi:hypothetical protein
VFTIDGRQSMFTAAPFGVKIMLGILQHTMEGLLSDMEIPPFLNDTAIASKSEEEHIATVKEVLRRLTYDAGLRINPKKCKFFRTEAKILGIIVSKEGTCMYPMKVEAIVRWPQPMDGKRMQKFMGMANFHQEFLHEFARIAVPLDEYRNEKRIIWTSERKQAFQNIKELFLRNIQLQHIDWSKKIFLTTDASQIELGA